MSDQTPITPLEAAIELAKIAARNWHLASHPDHPHDLADDCDQAVFRRLFGQLAVLNRADAHREAPAAGLPDPETLAMWFHDTYESLAPGHGYETRLSYREEWERVPEQNRRLMVATAKHVLTLIRGSAEPPLPGTPAHVHEWVDMTNERVRSGEICLADGAIRAAAESEGARK